MFELLKNRQRLLNKELQQNIQPVMVWTLVRMGAAFPMKTLCLSFDPATDELSSTQERYLQTIHLQGYDAYRDAIVSSDLITDFFALSFLVRSVFINFRPTDAEWVKARTTSEIVQLTREKKFILRLK